MTTAKRNILIPYIIIGIFGLAIIGGGIKSGRDAKQLSLDVRMFSAKVAADSAVVNALKYGGEKPDTTFNNIIASTVMNESHWNDVIQRGVFLCIVGTIGIAGLLNPFKKKIIEPGS